MKRLLTYLYIVYLILAFGAFFWGGFLLGQQTFEPRVVTYPVIETVVETEYIEVIDEVRVPVEVPVEVIVERPILLTDWESVEELTLFLEEDDTESHVYLRGDSEGWVSVKGTCEDYAMQLRDRAMAEGRYLSIESLTWPEVRSHYGTRLPVGESHAINTAIIGNELWYIEPQTDEIWLWGYLD